MLKNLVLFVLLFVSPAFLAAETITLRFFGPDGQPIPGATALAWSNPKPKNWQNRRFEVKADENGVAVVPFEPDEKMDTFYVSVKTSGFTPFHANWDNPKSDPVPNEYTFKLDKAETVGGTVLDDSGKPLAGVKLSFHFPHGDRLRIKRGDNFVLSADATTDENGQWRCDYVPPEHLDRLTQFVLEHPDFMQTVKRMPLSRLLAGNDGKFSETITMERGLSVTGQVNDESGQPVKGASVYCSKKSNIDNWHTATTDENGHFTFKNLPEAKGQSIFARADKFAPEMKDGIEIKAGMSPINIVLKSGKTIKAKVVDTNGKPIPKVWFAIERWRAHRLLTEQFGERKVTNDAGVFLWDSAPEDEVVFDLLPSGGNTSGFRTLRNQTLKPDDTEHIFTLQPSLKVSGKVFDAKTRNPIPQFKIHKGRRSAGSNRIYWYNNRLTMAQNGFFENSYNDESYDFFIKIEADGYAPKISPDILLSQNKVELEFALEEGKNEIERGISGLVQNSDGKPVSGVTVALVYKSLFPYIQNGELNESAFSTTTNQEGRFTLPGISSEESNAEGFVGEIDTLTKEPATKSDYKLFLLHSSGFAQVAQSDYEKSNKMITLEKWARVEGTVKIGSKPGKDVSMALQITEDELHAYYDYRSTSDNTGKFCFEKVPPGKMVVRLAVSFAIHNNGNSLAYSHGKNVQVAAGETATVQIGGVGRSVTGTLKVPDDFDVVPDWNFCLVEAIPKIEKTPELLQLEQKIQELRTKIPENIQKETNREICKQLLEEWKKTEEGKQYEETYKLYRNEIDKFRQQEQQSHWQSLACAVDREGNFRLEDVPAGDWNLNVTLNAPPLEDQCDLVKQLGNLKHQFIVPKISDGEQSGEPLKLGTLTLTKSKRRPSLISVGTDAPDFELKRLKNEGETETIKLSDYRNKIVVLDFWATWCPPCLEALPKLATFYEKFKDNPKVVLIGISIDNNDKTVLDFISKRNMNWIQLRTDPNSPLAEQYGIFSVPTMIVIAPDGKTAAVNPAIQELEKIIGNL
jgi:peroxiredoxin/protocatechuate 3,4-dioxygenase beta subunit